jgi:hypothetical protein
MMNDGVQTNLRAFDANRPLLDERHDDGLFQGNHNRFDLYLMDASNPMIIATTTVSTPACVMVLFTWV